MISISIVLCNGTSIEREINCGSFACASASVNILLLFVALEVFVTECRMRCRIVYAGVFLDVWRTIGKLIQFGPDIKQDYPLNLSISLSGGKETNKDSPSNGE
jgi:hypothetical protein